MLWMKRWVQGIIEKRYVEMRVRQYEKHLPWMIRWAKTASEVALTSTTKKAANVPADAWNIPEGLMKVEMRFRVDGAIDNPTATAHIYAARFHEDSTPTTRVYDDIVHIGDVPLTGGEQAATLDSSFYVDTLTVPTKWIDQIDKADADGQNGQARLVFDAVGYDCVFVKLEFSARNWWIDVSGFVNI